MPISSGRPVSKREWSPSRQWRGNGWRYQPNLQDLQRYNQESQKYEAQKQAYRMHPYNANIIPRTVSTPSQPNSGPQAEQLDIQEEDAGSNRERKTQSALQSKDESDGRNDAEGLARRNLSVHK